MLFKEPKGHKKIQKKAKYKSDLITDRTFIENKICLFFFIFVTKRSTAMETPPADEKLLVGASVKSRDVFLDHSSVSSINQAEILESVAYQDYMEKIMELNDKLDIVKSIVKPGCSPEVLNTALSYMSSLAAILSKMPQKLHASL